MKMLINIKWLTSKDHEFIAKYVRTHVHLCVCIVRVYAHLFLYVMLLKPVNLFR
jgi:hypothetical protein